MNVPGRSCGSSESCTAFFDRAICAFSLAHNCSDEIRSLLSGMSCLTLGSGHSNNGPFASRVFAETCYQISGYADLAGLWTCQGCEFVSAGRLESQDGVLPGLPKVAGLPAFCSVRVWSCLLCPQFCAEAAGFDTSRRRNRPVAFRFAPASSSAASCRQLRPADEPSAPVSLGPFRFDLVEFATVSRNTSTGHLIPGASRRAPGFRR